MDTSRALKKIANMEKQVAFAARIAANATARLVVAGQRELMTRELRQPIGFTLTAPFVRPAQPGGTTAQVQLRDNAGKGTPARKYLAPLVHGGARNLKRYEVALRRKGYLPMGMMTVASDAAINPAGNLTGPQVVRMLSALGAFAESGYLANRSKRSAKRRGKSQPQYFVRKTRWAGKPAGVYERIETGMMRRAKPVVLFTKAPRFRKQLHWYEAAEKIAKAEYPREFRAALARAMATAR